MMMLAIRRMLTEGRARTAASAILVVGLMFGAAACDSEQPADDSAADEGKDKDKDEAKDDDKSGEAAEAMDGEDAEGEADALDPRVAKAVDVADKIDADPERADEILDAAGLDRDSLSDLFYEIAADPALSQAYEAARSA